MTNLDSVSKNTDITLLTIIYTVRALVFLLSTSLAYACLFSFLLSSLVSALPKAMTNLDSVLKSKNITLPTKGRIVKAMVFLVIMYGCESWTIKKTQHQKTDAFELWYWSRLLRVPWTARRSNQSILKEINPKYLLEGLMLKLKFQYFGHLI